MKLSFRSVAALLLLSTLNYPLSTVSAQGTAFTYQGRLNDGANLANGSYDVAFTLYATNVTGSAIAGPVTNTAVAVTNGLFTTTVDFGNQFPGAARWLELAVSTNGANAFTTLTPRQALTATPYAITANSASNLLGNLPASQLSGSIPAATISGTIPLAQLPANLVTNGGTLSGNFSGTFSGNGAGLNNLSLDSLNNAGLLGWGTFAFNARLTLPSGCNDLATADINGDGKLDVISANTGSWTVSVLTNNGTGGLTLSTNIAFDGTFTVGHVAVGDLNGDGKADLTVGGANSFAVFLNNGTGGFYPGTYFTGGGGQIKAIAIADLNRDGKADLVTANGPANTVSVFTNNGAGGFPLAVSLPIGGGPQSLSIAVADVNGDGQPDLACPNGSYVVVYTNNGTGSFTVNSPGTIFGTIFIGVAAKDLNGDGKVDLALLDEYHDAVIVTNNGNGLFALASKPVVVEPPTAVAIADVNNDNKPDVLVVNGDDFNPSTLSVLLNQGNGQFSPAIHYLVGLHPLALVAADLNGDGQPDIVSGNSGENNLTVLFNTPTILGCFVGNGGGVTNLNATNLVGTVTMGNLPTTLVTNGASGVTISGAFTGNGANVTNVNAATLGGVSSAGFWKTNGNAGADPANGTFIGTTDNLPLEFKVNGLRALRLEPKATSPNLVGGYVGNAIVAGFGGVIGGGGYTNLPNIVSHNFATVVGGAGNSANGYASTVGGNMSTAQGFWSFAMGYHCFASSDFSTAMGSYSSATNDYATALGSSLAGGVNSTAMGGSFATGLGSTAMGLSSYAIGDYSTAMGKTTASGNYSTTMGYQTFAAGSAAMAAGSLAQATNDNSFVWSDGTSGVFSSSAANQFLIHAVGGVGIGSSAPKGMLEIQGGADSGGNSDGRSIALAYLGGGYRHWIRSRHNSFAPAGNSIDFYVNTGSTPEGSTGPGTNNVLGLTIDAANGGSVGVGTNTPKASLHVASSAGFPSAQLQLSQNNTSDSSRLRMNVGANPYWEMDVSQGATPSIGWWTTSLKMNLDFSGNLMVAGNVTANGVLLTSDRNAKENFTAVSPSEVLRKVAALPITGWNYKNGPATVRHVGPMAQDFQEAFGLNGGDDKHISVVDESGVALAAIQGLNQKLEEQKAENAELKQQLAELKALVQSLAEKR